MAIIDIQSYDYADDDYIDMEVSSYSNYLCHSKSSPPKPREFEFQMSFSSKEIEPSTSPADELFYKGKLLPLHLPPRLQMVEKLLQSSTYAYEYDDRKDIAEDFYSTPLATTAATPTTSTPFESCNISPSESFRVSRELNPDEYILEYATEVSSFSTGNHKKSWTKKLKQSSLGLKLKASRAYLKSFFSKSDYSGESYARAMKNADEVSISKANECLNKHVKVGKRNPFGQIQRLPSSVASFNKEKNDADGGCCHRRSFSMAIKRHSTTKSSTSSSSSSNSNNSSGFNELQFLKRCGSTNSEIENSIQGAIAHCKQSQSQKLLRTRKTVSEVAFYSLSASRISVCDDQDKPGLCRG